MLPNNDARHGTTRGFHAGCRCAPCRRARSRYEKESRLIRIQGGRRSVPAIGAQRRIQGLMRLGWSSTDIAKAAGWSNRNYVLRVINGQKGKPTTWLEARTDNTIREVFERMAMKLPEMTPIRARTRSLAAKKGYLPPLAWDDIDNPNERPVGVTNDHRAKDTIDPIVVERFLARDITPGLWATLAEKREIVRRWDGGANELERLTGWNYQRYAEQDGAA